MGVNALDFGAVYQAYYPSILSFLQARVNEPEAARDLTSAVFVAAWKHWPEYDPARSSVSTWLYCLARNRLKNYYRDQKPSVSLEAVDEAADAFDWQRADAPYRLTEWRDALALALAQLPERSRQAVVLRYFGGRSGQEIAAVLGVSEDNARVILSRGLRGLRNLLEQAGFSWKE